MNLAKHKIVLAQKVLQIENETILKSIELLFNNDSDAFEKEWQKAVPIENARELVLKKVRSLK